MTDRLSLTKAERFALQRLAEAVLPTRGFHPRMIAKLIARGFVQRAVDINTLEHLEITLAGREELDAALPVDARGAEQ